MRPDALELAVDPSRSSPLSSSAVSTSPAQPPSGEPVGEPETEEGLTDNPDRLRAVIYYERKWYNLRITALESRLLAAESARARAERERNTLAVYVCKCGDPNCAVIRSALARSTPEGPDANP